MKKYIYFGLLIVLVVGFLFSPYFINGRVPIALDIPTGMYYPWLNHNYGYPVHVPVKNAILTDTVSQFWIWRNWVMDGLRQGKIRIWNPYSFSGYEMSPWFGSNLLNPLNVFYAVFDKFGAMSWIVISQVIIGLIGGYVWSGGVMMPLVWTLSSYFLGWMTWGTVSLGLALLPWGLWAIDKKWWPILVALTILSGHPQTIMYVFLIWGIYGLIKFGNRQGWVKIVKIIMGAVLGLGIAAVVLYPSIPIIRDSIRLQENALAEENFGFIPPIKNLVLLLSPNFYGNPGTNNFWGGTPNYQESLVNFGVVGLYLGIIGLLVTLAKKKKTPEEKLALVCIVIGILLAEKYPLGWLIYYFKIPFLASSPAGRAWVLAIFGASVLAAIAAEDLRYKIYELRIRQKKIATAIIMLMFVIAGGYTTTFDGAQRNIAVRNLMVSGAIWLLAVALVSSEKWLKKLSWGGLVGLIIAEGCWFNLKYTPFVDKKLYFPETEAIKFLKNDPEKFFRVERQSAELLPPNMWQEYGLYSTSGYDPINPSSYGRYLIKKETRKTLGRYVENGNANDINKLDELGIKYWLVLKDDEGLVPKWVDQKKWKPVLTEGRVEVLKNNYYTPAYKTVNGSTVKLVQKDDDYWKFEVEVKAKDHLILRENFGDNWTVWIDNEKKEMEKIDDTFKGVDLDRGNKVVEMRYKNQEWETGKFISGICMALFGVVIIYSKIRKN